VFKSLEQELGEMGMSIHFTPSGQHNQIMERSVRTLKEKVEILKGSINYKLPKSLEKECLYYAVYLLNRTWNTITTTSTPWEIHTGSRLDMKRDPLLTFGQPVIVFQPQSLRTKSHHKRGEMGIYVGKNSNNSKGLQIYIPQRGRTVIRNTNYKLLQVIPDSWGWKENPTYYNARGDKDYLANNIQSPDTNPYSILSDDINDDDNDDNDDDNDDDDDDNETLENIDEHLSEIIRDDDGVMEVENESMNNESTYWSDPEQLDPTQNIISKLSRVYSTYTINSSDGIKPGEEPNNSKQLQQEAIRLELTQMNDKDVFETVTVLELQTTYKETHIINSLMFTKCKFNAQGHFVKWKGRLAARGDEQDWSPDNSAKSSPTANIISINTLLSLAINQKKIIWTSDVPGAYLHADINEIIIMRLPKTCTEIWLSILKIPESSFHLYIRKDYVYVKLKKALYGLLQSSLLWYKNISSFLCEIGFESCINDNCIFYREINNKMYYIGLYVDDLIHICDGNESKDMIASKLNEKYGKMDHHFGNQFSFLSLSINIDYINNIITIDQNNYITKILESFGDNYGKSFNQYPTSATFDKEICDFNESELLKKDQVHTYKSFIMSIMFVAIRTRPDLLFAINVLSTKMSQPSVNDMEALDYLIGYIRAHPSLHLTYTCKNSDDNFWDNIELFIDASWSLYGNSKGQSGCILRVFGNTVLCKTMKQHIVTKSSTESEIVAVDDFLPYGIWLCNLLRELKINYKGPMTVYQDNTSGVKIIKKGFGNFKRTKHFINKFYWIKQYVDNGTIDFKYIPTNKMSADIFTKSLTGYLFYVFIYFIMDPNFGKKFIT
jgi:hypothetical protein